MGTPVLVVRMSLSLLVILLTCWGAPSAIAAPFRLGTNVWPGYEPLYLARSLGHLPEEDVKLVEFRSTTQVMNALRTEAIEAGTMTLDEAISLASGGLNLTIVHVLDVSSGADVIVARPGIKTINELAGRRVGVENTALGAYVLLRALELSSMALDQVTVVSLEPGSQTTAIKEDRADAVVCFEPVRGELIRSGCGELFSSTQIPGEIVDLLVVRTAVLEEFRSRATRFESAWAAALEQIAEEPEKSYEFMGRRLGLDAADTRSAFQGLSLLAWEESSRLLAPGGTVEGTMLKLRAYMLREGLIAGEGLPQLFVVPQAGGGGR